METIGADELKVIREGRVPVPEHRKRFMVDKLVDLYLEWVLAGKPGANESTVGQGGLQ